MKMRSFLHALFFSCIFVFSSCSLLGEPEELYFPFNEQAIRHVMDSVAQADGGKMYADDYLEQLYSLHNGDSTGLADTLYWVSKYGMDERAETLLAWLGNVEEQGLKRETFRLDEMAADLADFRKLRPDSCTQAEVCELMGRLEYRLSRAYLRFLYGQRFGYVRPSDVFNRLLGTRGSKAYRNLYDIPAEVATDSLFYLAISKLPVLDEMALLLSDVQPVDSLFHRFCREYNRLREVGEERLADLARVNLERTRWRYERPADTGKYVMVNIPSFELEAVDNDGGRRLNMKVCCGSKDHQTPLLLSRIGRLELNPYWTVPTSIIKNEIVPRHTGDAGYFGRNRMFAVERSSGQRLSAASLSASQWLSGKYALRQERGAGNSLGRMIFRFPNSHSVYLHDTNSPGAFSREVRAVSHGCVRVQRPLDLAVFLLTDPDDLYVDKIRVAVDKAPLTEEGRQYAENTDTDHHLNSCSFKPSIPVYIDYFTLYPDSTGTFRQYDDVYGYDKPLKDALAEF